MGLLRVRGWLEKEATGLGRAMEAARKAPSQPGHAAQFHQQTLPEGLVCVLSILKLFWERLWVVICRSLSKGRRKDQHDEQLTTKWCSWRLLRALPFPGHWETQLRTFKPLRSLEIHQA